MIFYVNWVLQACLCHNVSNWEKVREKKARSLINSAERKNRNSVCMHVHICTHPEHTHTHSWKSSREAPIDTIPSGLIAYKNTRSRTRTPTNKHITFVEAAASDVNEQILEVDNNANAYFHKHYIFSRLFYSSLDCILKTYFHISRFGKTVDICSILLLEC